MFNTMMNAGSPPEWWMTTREIAWIAVTAWQWQLIMGVAVAGGLIAMRYLGECK